MTATAEALFEAIQKGDAGAAGQIAAEQPQLLETRNAEGVSPILLALYYRQADIAQALAASKPALDMSEACALGRRDRVLGLLAAGDNAQNQPGPDGHWPLGLACFFGHTATAALLLDRGADPNAVSKNALAVAPIHAASASQSVEIVRILLEKGADAGARQPGGATALHTAANAGNFALAELLLSHGADPQATMSDAKTPADLARSQGHESLLQLLAANS